MDPNISIKSSLEEKIEKLQEHSEALESSYAFIVKEKETLSNEHSGLQINFNELQISYELSKERCNELETKVNELERVILDNKGDNVFSGLEQKCRELEVENDEYEKKLEAMRYELEKQTGILEVAKSNLKLTLAEKNELETRFDEYKQEFIEKENSYKQDQLEFKKKIEELEAQQLKQEQIEVIEERWKKKFEELQKENDEKIQQLQKENDEKIQEYESNKNNLLQGRSVGLDKMHLTRDEYDKQFVKTRERVKLVEQEKKAALEQVEKLLKKVAEEIVECIPIVTAYDSSNSNEQLIEESKADKNSLKEINQKLNERTEISRLLSKYLWEYYNNLRTLTNAMGLSIPLKSEKPIVINSSIEEEKVNSKTSESRLSDSYDAEDLGKFFSSDISNEQTEWPKDKYETLLALSTKVDLNEVRDMIRKTPKDAENLVKKYQQENKLNKDKYRKANKESKEKIAVRNFKSGDLALFLPTRNSTAKHWAAFNINCPHYFLCTTETVVNQIRNRDWIVARIVNIIECVVDMKNPNTNPYDLPDGVMFHLLDVDGFMDNSTTSRKAS